MLFFEGVTCSELWDFGLNQNDTLSEGMLEVQRVFFPNFVVTFVVLTAFATACRYWRIISRFTTVFPTVFLAV